MEDDIPAYFFPGGLAAGTALLAAGADLTGRPALRRASRLGALGGLVASMWFLVADLGRPERFHHMLRVAKPTSPMSVGTWILTAYGPGGRRGGAERAGAAAVAAHLAGPPAAAGSPARPGSRRRPLAPAVASYTAVLLSHTAVPAWHEVRDELPFVFTGSAAASAGGLGMIVAPVEENGPARVFAAAGAVQELVASRVMENRLGLVREAYEHGQAARLGRAAEVLNVGGAARHGVSRRPKPHGRSGVGVGPAGGQRPAALPRVRRRRRVDQGPEVRRRSPARASRGPRPHHLIEQQNGSAPSGRNGVRRPLHLRNDDLVLLQHRLHRPLGPRRVRIAEQLVQPGRDDLP